MTKMNIVGLIAGMVAMVGMVPLPVYAQSKEVTCICEERCTEDCINEECEVCIYDYNFCEGEEIVKETVEENYGPLTPDGNMDLVDDYGSIEAGGKQFITVTTKSGNFFYIIIDRDDEGTETVHFLNLVDESDLLTLMEEEEVESYMESKGMTVDEEQTQEPETHTEEMSEESTEEETMPETEEKGKNVTGIMGIVLILALCGMGGFMYLKFGMTKKKQDAPDPDADYFDSEDEDDYLTDMDVEDESVSEREDDNDFEAAD